MLKKEIIIQTDTGLRRIGDIFPYDSVENTINFCGLDATGAAISIDGQYLDVKNLGMPIGAFINMKSADPVRMVLNYKENPYLRQNKIVTKNYDEAERVMRIHALAGVPYSLQYRNAEQEDVWTFEHEAQPA